MAEPTDSELSPTTDAVLHYLSTSVIVLSFIYKLPQIYQVLRSGSTTRISVHSLVYESLSYSVFVVYHFAFDYPLYTYGEHIVAILQEYILMAIVLTYREELDVKWITGFLAYLAVCLALALRWLPHFILYTSMLATTPMLLWSKFVQLTEILHHKHRGEVNMLTWGIVTYETAVRMLTTALVTKDTLYGINLASTEFLNIAILCAIFYY